jgi:hypothetical protein
MAAEGLRIPVRVVREAPFRGREAVGVMRTAVEGLRVAEKVLRMAAKSLREAVEMSRARAVGSASDRPVGDDEDQVVDVHCAIAVQICRA